MGALLVPIHFKKSDQILKVVNKALVRHAFLFKLEDGLLTFSPCHFHLKLRQLSV
jgi:hypothetical protein